VGEKPWSTDLGTRNAERERMNLLTRKNLSVSEGRARAEQTGGPLRGESCLMSARERPFAHEMRF